MKIILSIAVGLILLFIFIRFLEYKSLYFPLSRIEATPKDVDIHYEDVTVTTSDGIRISGWFIPAKNPRATILFCHGNGGNISHRLEKISMFNSLGLSVFIFDYRGYGKSNGSPSEKGLYLDAEAAYQYLLHKKGLVPEKVIAYGESLGGAVAVDLAVRHKIGGVIIEEGFTSSKDMGRVILPFIPSFIYKSEFDSLDKIKHIKAPKLIFHSENDEIVPFELGKRLFDEAPEPKEFVQLRGGHNEAFVISEELFMGKLDQFIGRQL